MEFKAAAIAALVAMGGALLAGKALRRLILLPFEWLARKTNSKADDIIVAEAEKDLGIESPTLGGGEDASEAKK